MMIIFGGRDSSENALNDTWGLRRHRKGNWDWVSAPYKTEGPKNRYNVLSF
jgi:protein phosphatase